MTRKKLESLARRAVACKRWRWMPGMAVLPLDGVPNRVVSVETGVVYEEVETYPSEMTERLLGRHWCGQWRECGMLPDLSDPATLGCLLALVRKVYPNTRFMQDGWRMTSTLFLVHAGMDWELERRCYDAFEKLNVDGTWSQSGQDRIRVKSEAEALVAALEAAP